MEFGVVIMWHSISFEIAHGSPKKKRNQVKIMHKDDSIYRIIHYTCSWNEFYWTIVDYRTLFYKYIENDSSPPSLSPNTICLHWIFILITVIFLVVTTLSMCYFVKVRSLSLFECVHFPIRVFTWLLFSVHLQLFNINYVTRLRMIGDQYV